MSILLMILGGCCGALSSFCMRKGLEHGGSTRGYLSVQLLCSLIAGVLLNPVRTGNYGVCPSAIITGCIVGMFLTLMLFFLGRALEKGPPALTFAFLNSATVVPVLLMSLLIGSSDRIDYSSKHLIGSILVLVGLFWAGSKCELGTQRRRWVVFASTAFCLQVVILTLLEWRALWLEGSSDPSWLFPVLPDPTKSEWFMPSLFLAAILTHVFLPAQKTSWRPGVFDLRFGVIGGLANGASTYCLALAPRLAAPWESPIIFPLFAVTVILGCNLWARAIYKERIHWLSSGLCLFGIVLGSL